MIRVPCSKCHRLFYVKKVEGADACPHCSPQVHDHQVPERRCATREKREIPLMLRYRGKEYKGLTFDLSREGLGVKIFAGNHFLVKDKFSLYVNEENIRARVAWTRELPEYTLAGIQRLN
jgi:hypothetical protein